MKEEGSHNYQDLAVYDQQLAIGIAGGNPQIAAELLGLLIRELPFQQEALNRAYGAGDLVELRKISHKLHGSASYCGTSALKAATQNLEAHLPHGEAALIARAYIQVLDEIHRLLEMHGSV